MLLNSWNSANILTAFCLKQCNKLCTHKSGESELLVFCHDGAKTDLEDGGGCYDCIPQTGYIISFFQSPSFKYYVSNLGGRGRICADLASTGGGQNLGRPTDVILERSLLVQLD